MAVLTFSSCKKQWQDECKGIICHNGGGCVYGKCDCIDGYQGARCDSLNPFYNPAKTASGYYNTTGRDVVINSHTDYTDQPVSAQLYIEMINRSTIAVSGNKFDWDSLNSTPDIILFNPQPQSTLSPGSDVKYYIQGDSVEYNYMTLSHMLFLHGKRQ